VPSPRPEAPPVTTAAIDPSSFMAGAPMLSEPENVAGI
jgi:hypothetical protein